MTDAWKDFCETYEELTNPGSDASPIRLTPNEKKHGRLIRVDMEAYGNRLIYEDGFEDWFSIGD